MSNDNNVLKPLCEPIGQLLNSGMEKMAELIAKGICKITGTQTESLRQKELEKKLYAMEESNKLKDMEQQVKDIEREKLVDKKNNVFVDGERYNFSDLFFNIGLTNKSKEMPILKRYEVKEVCNIFTFECPVGVTKSKIEEKIEEIAAFFETYEGNIEIRKHKNLIDIIVITSDIFDKVYDYDPNAFKSIEGLKIPLGFFLSDDYEIKMLVTDMSKNGYHSMLVAGSSGFGKSSAIRLILLHLVLNYPPEYLQIVIFAGKGDNDFLFMYDTPHLYNNKCYIDLDEIVGNEPTKKEEGTKGILDDLVEEVVKRNAILKKYGCKDIDEYYRKGHKDLPYKLVVFDEYSYMHSHKKFSRLQSLMGSLISTARSCGIRVITAMQDSQKEYYITQMRYNTNLKICYKAENSSHSRNMCNQDGLELIRRKGECRFYAPNMSNGKEYVMMKSILPPEDTDVLIKMIKNKYK